MQTLFQDGDEQINGDGAPDLGAHRVGAGAIKSFDPQMLLDPFEEQFDLPASAIELGDGQCWHGEVVGQEDERVAATTSPRRTRSPRRKAASGIRAPVA